MSSRAGGAVALSIVLMAAPVPSRAADTPERSTKDRPTPPVRIERASTRFVFQNDGTGSVTSELRYRVLTDSGRQGAGQAYVLYASKSEEASVESLKTIKPDGRVLESDGAAMDVTPPPTAQAPQFSDLQAKVRVARSVDVGDIVEARLVRSIVRPLKAGDFWADYTLPRGVPVDAQEVTLDVPADRAILVRWDPAHTPKKATKDGRTIYAWTLGPMDEDPKDQRPLHPLFVASSMSPDQLGAWYVQLQADRTDVTPEIKAKAESLTTGLTTPRQKLEALYLFVATSVRYVSISFGIGGYQPHAPSEVLHNLFGDCKDKDLLLRALLAAAGIGARPAIVNSTLGIPEPEVGSPGQFDHVLTVATIDGDAVWLDATSGLAPFGVLPPNIRGRKALLTTSEGARVVEIPQRSPVPDRGTMTMTGKLDAAGTFSGESTISASGLSEVWIRALLRSQSPEPTGPTAKLWGLMTTGYGSKVDKFESSDAASLGVPLRIACGASVSWIEPAEMKSDAALPSTLIAMRSMAWSSGALEKLPVDEPYRLGDPGDVHESLSLDIDPSYAVSVPASVKVERPFASYESTYALAGHTLTVRRALTLLAPQLPNAKKDELIAFHDVIQRDLEQHVVVRRTAKPDLRKLGTMLDAEALNEAGTSAIDRGDYELARDLLKLSIEKDPKHKEAWNNLGRAHMMLGNLDDAERSFTKQIEINPKDAYAYSNLGRVYGLRGDFAKSEAQLRKQLEINPLDAWANTGLGDLLAMQERWPEAVEVLSRTAQLKHDDVGVQIALARALAKTGRNDDARAHATELLTDELGPAERLQIAHVLAEARLDLDRADTEASRVMRDAASRCRGASLDGVPDDYWSSIGMLIGGYEVRGTVAFQKGEIDRAATSFRTGYDLGLWPTTALWLARVYARQGDPEKGLRYYAFATRLAIPGRPVAPPEELHDYLAAAFKGDSAAQAAKVNELARETMMLDRVYPEKGEFTLPDKYPGDGGITFNVKVLVDENGAVEDARADSAGKEPFLAAALKDVRRMRFQPLGLPGASIKSVRLVEIFYLPTKEVRAFAHFQPPSDANELRMDRVLPRFNDLRNTP